MNAAILLVLPFVLTAPTIPKKLPHSKPSKIPKGAPVNPEPITGDAVSTIPAIPSDLKLLYVPAKDFDVRGDMRKDLFKIGVGVDKAGIAGVAYPDLPLGATIEWMDCRVDMSNSGRSQELSGTARIQLTFDDYQTAPVHDIYGEKLVDLEFSLDKGKSMYWKGDRVDKARFHSVAEGDRVFLIRVTLTAGSGTYVSFRGCRIGYTP